MEFVGSTSLALVTFFVALYCCRLAARTGKRSALIICFVAMILIYPGLFMAVRLFAELKIYLLLILAFAAIGMTFSRKRELSRRPGLFLPQDDRNRN